MAQEKRYKLVKFYRRQYERNLPTLAAALAVMEAERQTATAECYTQLWEMSNETDGEMVGFFENGAAAELHVTATTRAVSKR